MLNSPYQGSGAILYSQWLNVSQQIIQTNIDDVQIKVPKVKKRGSS
ncbi:MAG: hypothetical protein ACTS7E_02060 [Arsenophonus sp. NC-CH8-MAG3]